MNKRFSTNQNRRLSKGSADSKLSLFDRGSNDLELFNLVDEELIRLSGSKIYYYKSFIDESYDKVYLESRNRIVSKTPIVLWASFDPRAIEEEMSEFGLELTNDQTFVFNKSYIEQNLGRPPQEGDVIKTTFQNIKYEIIEVQEDSFESYGSYHYNCFAKVLRDSSDVVDEEVEVFERVGTKVYLKTDNSFTEIPPVYSFTKAAPPAGGGDPGGGGDPTSNDTKIRWSPEGIIYVNAPNDTEGFYALGFVHAREFGDSLFASIATSTGKVSTLFSQMYGNGSFTTWLDRHVPTAITYGIDENGHLDPLSTGGLLNKFDRFLHFYEVPEASEELYAELDANDKQKVDSFASGVNAAMTLLWEEPVFDIARSFFPEGPPVQFLPQHFIARDQLRMMGGWMAVIRRQLGESLRIYPEAEVNFGGESLTGENFPFAGNFSTNAEQFLSQVRNIEIPTLSGVGVPNTGLLYNEELSGIMFSNEWVFNGGITTTGKPLLQIDPHLGQKSIDFRFITVSYRSSQTEVAGSMIAGIPNILLGYNRDVGWALTAGSTISIRFYSFFVVRDANDPENIIRYPVAVGDLDEFEIEYRNINKTFKEVEPFKPPMPKYKSETTDKYQIGNVIKTWYTSSLGTIQPPPGTPSIPGNGVVYEIGLAYRFAKDFRLNGIRFFSSLNKAKTEADIVATLERLDTPFYNFMYATKNNNVGYYSLGAIPDFSKNSGYGRGFDPTNPTTFSSILINTVKFSHQTPIIYFSSLHPLSTLPTVKNPRTGWLANNNVTPNYVTTWDGDSQKEIFMSAFPTYMHEVFYNLGTERQLQAQTTFQIYLAQQPKISLNDAKNIISGKGGTAAAPFLNEVSLHFSYILLNFFASYVTNKPLLQPNIYGYQIDYARIEPEIYLWAELARNSLIRATAGDRIHPRVFYFLNKLYSTYGTGLEGLPALNQYGFHRNWGRNSLVLDIMKWQPATELVDALATTFLCYEMNQAIDEYEMRFGTSPFEDVFKANSAASITNPVGTLYPLNYGGNNLKQVAHILNTDGNSYWFEAFAGQVFAMLVDFSTPTPQSFLLKPFNGTIDQNRNYSERLTQKWANSEMTAITDFGFIPDGQFIEEVVITRM